MTDDGKYAVVSTHEECRDNLVYIADLSNGQISGKLNLTQIVYELKHDYHFLHNVGSRFYFWTNAGAPNYRVVCRNTSILLDSRVFGS